MNGDDNNAIVIEFTTLLEKSKHLFNGMRELPQFGHRHWQNYFARTFDVYTKLWKFQQKHRQILDSQHNLKRWQIGEIASKIGQLYYHYYLRTSDASYLTESYAFYRAIRNRAYYSKAVKEEKPDVMIKKLRYYARFIVVCLLLRKIDDLSDLVKELSRCLDEYVEHYQVKENGEWQVILKEVHSFLMADNIVPVIKDNGTALIIENRLKYQSVPLNGGVFGSKLKLQDAIIIGNCAKQIKFSELTIDMYRMLQTLEYVSSKSDIPFNKEPGNHVPIEENKENPETTAESSKPAKPSNPHKYLLYRPTFFQLYAFLSSMFKELPIQSAVLIYISADGSPKVNLSEHEGYYEQGGISTVNKGISASCQNPKRQSQVRDINCLHPEDLVPFSRKPMFLIMESDNSIAFSNFPQLFGQPVVCLMSPIAMPPSIAEKSQQSGSIFTLFLHCPLLAFSYICDVSDMQHSTWEKCQALLQEVWEVIASNMGNCPTLGFSFRQFMQDEFLRQLLHRFIFCYCTLSLHKSFKTADYYPLSFPKMPVVLTEAANLRKYILDLATLLNVGHYFYHDDAM